MTVTFPTVISTFTYCYVADAYLLAFLFSCIAVYLLTHKGLLATIPAVALLTLSLGIYQAYITVAIALLMCSLLIRLISGENTCKVSLKSALKYLVCGTLSLLLYYCINSAVMALMHVEASDYQNISGTFSFKEFDLISAIISAYYSFFKFFFDFDGGFKLYSAVNIAVYAALFIGYAALAVKNKRHIAVACCVIYYGIYEKLFVDDALTLLGIFSSVCFISLLGDIKPIPNFLQLICRDSFPIYLLHTFFTAAVRILLLKLGVANYTLHVIAGMTAGLIFPIAAARLCSLSTFLDILFYPSRSIKKIRSHNKD